jgi:2-dehydro-3-deoxyglucarate aldolase
VGLARAQGYGLEFEKYKNWVNEYSIVVVQIEHIEAINNLESILQVEGIDASIIGPYDLSASIGYPGEFSRPEIREVIDRYLQVCKKTKKPAGFHIIPPDGQEIKTKVKEGFKFLGFSLDTLFLGRKIKDELSKFKRGYK